MADQEETGSSSSSGEKKSESTVVLDNVETTTTDQLNESTINMCEVLKEQEDKEAEAMAVLGGSDENNCTYTKGYIKRQALYSCMTCIPESRNCPEKRAGICLACSLTCHEQHDLIELYTKRHFRCDCGGSKMKGVRCLLEPTKFGLNDENKYNQNFSGLYCVCERPYPDPEDKIVDEMIQCIVCEDWYHGRHLNTDIPECDDFSEMICGKCMDALPFLSCYLKYAVNKALKRDEDTEPAPTKKLKPACGRGEMMERPDGMAIFWMDDWRLELCKCEECTALYGAAKVEYLLDPDDTVQKYEEAGKSRCANLQAVDPINTALSTLGHVQQIDLITRYNRFKDRLKEFLHAFAQNKQVVTEEDINRFFETMKNEKKHPSTTNNFCR